MPAMSRSTTTTWPPLLWFLAVAFIAAPRSSQGFVPPTTTTSSRTLLFASAAEVTARLADETLLLESEVFGDRVESQLSLLGSGKARFSAGLVAAREGDWRVVQGDPEEGEDPRDCFLEFSQPLTWFYAWRFDIRADEVYWRGRVLEEEPLRVVEGVAISESVWDDWTEDWRKALDLRAAFAKYVLGNKFQKEGTFQATLVDPAELPQPLNLEFVYEEEEEEVTFFAGDKKPGSAINRFTPDDMTVKLEPVEQDDDEPSSSSSSSSLPVEEEAVLATPRSNKRKRKRAGAATTTKKGFSGGGGK